MVQFLFFGSQDASSFTLPEWLLAGLSKSMLKHTSSVFFLVPSVICFNSFLMGPLQIVANNAD